MATREILYCGHPVLRRKAKRVRNVDDALLALIEDMKQTMVEAPGVGLAAPQLGESVRVIVVRADDEEDTEIHALLNPHIAERSGQEGAMEGCLSLPTLRGEVPRAASVVAVGTTPEGGEISIHADGLLARALQHEIDHLDGVLFLDRALRETLCWVVPDEDEEDGYRLDGTTVEEVTERFRRLQERRARRQGG